MGKVEIAYWRTRLFNTYDGEGFFPRWNFYSLQWLAVPAQLLRLSILGSRVTYPADLFRTASCAVHWAQPPWCVALRIAGPTLTFTITIIGVQHIKNLLQFCPGIDANVLTWLKNRTEELECLGTHCFGPKFDQFGNRLNFHFFHHMVSMDSWWSIEISYPPWT